MLDMSQWSIVCQYPIPPEVSKCLNEQLLISLGLNQYFLEDLERAFKKSLDNFLLRKFKYNTKLSKSFEEMITELKFSVMLDLMLKEDSIKQAGEFEKSVIIQNIIAKSIQSVLIDLRGIRNV